MILELYGVDDDEQEFRKSFKNLQAVHMCGDFLEVVKQDGTHHTVAYSYMDGDSVYWMEKPLFKDGNLNIEYTDLPPQYSGLNIIS